MSVAQNISVGSARSSVTSNGGPGGDASGHDRLLNPENALPDTLVRMGSSHGTPLLSNSFSTEMPRKPKWGGDASRHKNQLAISNQADMMMTGWAMKKRQFAKPCATISFLLNIFEL